MADRLADGQIVAVDRSPKMIEAAERRNAGHVAAGRARIVHGPFGEADVGRNRFDTIFAVHVADFWRRASEWLPVAARLLVPGGRLALFNQSPGWRSADAGREWGEQVARVLGAHGFPGAEVTVGDLEAPVAGVIARTR